jgi:hypothetical protein
MKTFSILAKALFPFQAGRGIRAGLSKIAVILGVVRGVVERFAATR